LLRRVGPDGSYPLGAQRGGEIAARGLPRAVGHPGELPSASRSAALIGERRRHDATPPSAEFPTSGQLRRPGATHQAVDFLVGDARVPQQRRELSHDLDCLDARVFPRPLSMARLRGMAAGNASAGTTSSGPHRPTNSAVVSSAPVRSSARRRSDDTVIPRYLMAPTELAGGFSAAASADCRRCGAHGRAGELQDFETGRTAARAAQQLALMQINAPPPGASLLARDGTFIGTAGG